VRQDVRALQVAAGLLVDDVERNQSVEWSSEEEVSEEEVEEGEEGDGEEEGEEGEEGEVDEEDDDEEKEKVDGLVAMLEAAMSSDESEEE
jgi:hypothetical protein